MGALDRVPGCRGHLGSEPVGGSSLFCQSLSPCLSSKRIQQKGGSGLDFVCAELQDVMAAPHPQGLLRDPALWQRTPPRTGGRRDVEPLVPKPACSLSSERKVLHENKILMFSLPGLASSNPQAGGSTHGPLTPQTFLKTERNKMHRKTALDNFFFFGGKRKLRKHLCFVGCCSLFCLSGRPLYTKHDPN